MSGRQPPLRLTRRGAVDRHAPAVREAAETFRRRHCTLLPSLVDLTLLSSLQDQIDRGTFVTKHHGSAATELCLEPDATVGLLHFLVNDPAVYRLVEEVTGSAPVRSLFGRVYRHVPGTDHHQKWHDDVSEHRAAGLSINLSREAYEGGVFEIRERDQPATVTSLPNIVPGDAILFELGDAVEHRVTALQGTMPKTAFAGWFRREPDYLQALRIATGRARDSA